MDSPKPTEQVNKAPAFAGQTTNAFLNRLTKDNDPVNSPNHYTSHRSGIECIQITEHMGFNLGNALKYIWRADLKENRMQDLEKAKWYIERELSRYSHCP